MRAHVLLGGTHCWDVLLGSGVRSKVGGVQARRLLPFPLTFPGVSKLGTRKRKNGHPISCHSQTPCVGPSGAGWVGGQLRSPPSRPPSPPRHQSQGSKPLVKAGGRGWVGMGSQPAGPALPEGIERGQEGKKVVVLLPSSCLAGFLSRIPL